MSDMVVDSSVVVKWLLPEADSRQAQRLFNEVTGRRERLVALDLGVVEAANAVWKGAHRKLISGGEARRLVGDLLAIPLQVQPAGRLLTAAFGIALQYDRAVYDALFVALVQDLGLPGVTADEPLWRAVHADFPDIVLLRDWR